MNMKNMDLDKRDEEIYTLREDGATFSHIGSLFNITRNRARQVYCRLKYRKDHFGKWPPLKRVLSFRSQNGIKNHFKNKNILMNPKKIVEIGGRDLLKTRNIGLKTIREIASALHNLGYISDVNNWLNKQTSTSTFPSPEVSYKH